MIVNKDVKPNRKIYYLGALVIEILGKKESPEVGYLDLYFELCEVEQVSIDVFSLTLDWLFILGILDINHGKIKKCF